MMAGWFFSNSLGLKSILNVIQTPSSNLLTKGN